MTHFRKSKLERFIKRLEAKIPVYADNPAKLELLKEIIAEMKHEFQVKE